MEIRQATTHTHTCIYTAHMQSAIIILDGWMLFLAPKTKIISLYLIHFSINEPTTIMSLLQCHHTYGNIATELHMLISNINLV